MDKTHSLQLPRQTALSVHSPLIFLKASGRMRLSSAWGSRHFPCLISAEETYFPLSYFFAHTSNLFHRRQWLLHTPFLPDFMLPFYQKAPSYTIQNTATGVCENFYTLNQKKPLQPPALTLSGQNSACFLQKLGFG